MKKLLLILLSILILSIPAYSSQDTNSAEYLRNKRHFSPMNAPVESMAQKIIKSSLKKETGANFKVKFSGYTLSSMKKGIFKYLEITGKDVVVEGIELPYVNLKSLSDYNWVDYTQDPIKFRSDMEFQYNLNLSEKTINDVLKDKEYQNVIKKVNKLAYPLFTLSDVRTRIRNGKIHLIMEYNFPITPMKQNKTFMVSTGFRVDNGKIKACNVSVDNAYGNVSITKVTNLINLLDPLTFALELLDSKKCTAKLESIKIEDDTVYASGRIFVKGDKS